MPIVKILHRERSREVLHEVAVSDSVPDVRRDRNADSCTPAFNCAVLKALGNGLDLFEADLSFLDMGKVKGSLKGAKLSGALLIRANLSGLDLSSANLSNAFMGDADLRNTILRGADLSGAVFNSADLRGADLRDANLTGADFMGAKLQGALFKGANLKNVYLRDMEGADLTGTTS